MTIQRNDDGEDFEPTVEFVEEMPRLPDRVVSVMRLKLAGASDAEIAQVLSLDSVEMVEQIVVRALRKDMMRSTETREMARRLMKQKLDTLFNSVAKKALDPNHPDHLAAVGKARELLAQQAKLLGLEAATEVTVHTPTTAELTRFVEQASGLANLPQDSDLFDVEVIEGEIED